MDSTLAQTITQTGNTFSGTIAVTDLNGTQEGTISGTIIGNHITERAVALGGHIYSFDATVTGQTISGTWVRTDNTDHNGTFTMTKA